MADAWFQYFSTSLAQFRIIKGYARIDFLIPFTVVNIFRGLKYVLLLKNKRKRAFEKLAEHPNLLNGILGYGPRFIDVYMDEDILEEYEYVYGQPPHWVYIYLPYLILSKIFWFPP